VFCRQVLGGLAFAAAAALLASVALAEDRMQLGVAGAAAEFQTQAGDRVFFADGSAELGARARAALAAQAAWLSRHPTVAIVIEGHADDAGASNHNLDVSWRRADAVRRRLIEMGVAPARIRTVGYGRDRLIAECTAPACSAQNRRAVTVVEAPASTADRAAEPSPGARDSAAKRSPRRLY
jgi:peptidoglycan-associated lipoprotein